MNFIDNYGEFKPIIKAYAKQHAFIWWQESFAQKQVLISSLEDLIYNTLEESELIWYDNKFHDITTWYFHN